MYYYHFDGLGSVVALSDVNSVIVERYSYDVFGAPTVYDANGVEVPQSAVGNPYLFTARRADDETALYYYRARYYAFDIGRFLQPDPVGYGDSLDLYTYCANNPLNWSDPYGLCKDTVKYNYWSALSDAHWKIWERICDGVILTSNAITFHQLEGRGIPGWVDSADALRRSGSFGRASQYCGYGVDALLAGAGAIQVLGLDVTLWGTGAGATAASGGLDPVRIGQAGEQAVRAAYDIGPKVAVRLGNRTIVPDGLTSERVSEVKNVAYQAWTQQLQNYSTWASQNERAFDLYIRSTTTLSSTVQAAEASGLVTTIRAPGMGN